ncbi:hypothetical protein HHI36_023460 [Cryptolaemus montrouzieri]|uniref:Uncharacterized protein n=1 Tax=Cryptolaemus montrouzieri TaxID=559131 RepID=A0ABD2PGL0_9CUCU
MANNVGDEADKLMIEEALKTVKYDATLIKFFRVVMKTDGQRHPRMIKVVMPHDHNVREILRNKKKLLKSASTRGFTFVGDLQQQLLKELRDELERRKNNGQTNLTIKYKGGIPKIVANFCE